MKHSKQNRLNPPTDPIWNRRNFFSFCTSVKQKYSTGIPKEYTGGFTMLELLVTIAIYIMMISIVLASYRTFNTNAIFANASEDIILALRQAQVYGVGTKTNSITCGVQASAFACPYGVHIDMSDANGLTIFVDLNSDKVYTSGFDAIVKKVTWVPVIAISSIQCGAVPCFGNKINITFTRPTPDAFIADNGGVLNRVDSGTIVLRDANSGKISTVTITSAGQISIQ